MAQLTDDCFAFGGPLTSVEAARARLETILRPVTGIETVPLQAALGRVLATDVEAQIDVPPHANSAVDGYAVFFDDLSPDAETALPVTGRVAAGHGLGRAGVRGEAIRIFTGAPMPLGFDTVLMQEDCRHDGDTVLIPRGIKRGANRRGAGEDITKGTVILAAGHVLRPQDIGLVASVGRAVLPVRTRLRVALFSTGDEVCNPGTPLPAHGIYDANRFLLHALLHATGAVVTDFGIVPDDFETLRDLLVVASADHDLVLTSGGASTGDEDHIKPAVEALGALHVWRLAIKPGRPVALGVVQGTPFVGLPGNPVAVMVTFLTLARPLVRRLSGASDADPLGFRVTADFAYTKKIGRREFVRVRLIDERHGPPRAQKFPRDGAGILSSLVHSDGLVELGEDISAVTPGTAVRFLPFGELLR